MKRCLYILVLLVVFPSYLFAGKWDGKYEGSGFLAQNCFNNKAGYQARQIRENQIKISFTVKDGKVNGNLRTIIAGIDCRNVTKSFLQFGVSSDGKFSSKIDGRDGHKPVIISVKLNEKKVELNSERRTSITLRKISGPSNTLPRKNKHPRMCRQSPVLKVEENGMECINLK